MRSFTLLEMVISLGLLALLAGLAVMAGASVTRSWSKLEARQQQFAELMQLDRTLDNMLSNVAPLTWKNEDGEERPYFLGLPESVRFAYRHRITDVEEGALRFVRLELNDGAFRARYGARPTLAESGLAARGRESVLAENVARVHFQYAIIREDMDAEDTPEWVTEWMPETWSQSQRRLHRRPLAVRIQVEWRDGRVESWLRRLPGASRFERSGPWRPLDMDS